MRYLLSEVEFYVPSIKEYQSHVVVIRRDQLDGERLFIAPKDLFFASANYGPDKKYNVIDNFADIVIFAAQTDGLEVAFDSESESTLRVYDSVNDVVATLLKVDGNYLILSKDVSNMFELLKQFLVENLGTPAYIVVPEGVQHTVTEEVPETVSETEKETLVENDSEEGAE